MLTQDEIRRQIEAIGPWHYNHVIDGISTGDSPIEEVHPKLQQLINANAFPRNVYPKVLDLGANSGLLSMWFADRKLAHVTAVEGNPRYFNQLEFVIKAKGYTGRIFPIHQDLHKPKLSSNMYDLVLCLGLLHHIRPAQHLRLLKACYRALIPSGETVIQTDDQLPVERLLWDSGFQGVEKLLTHWHDRAAWKAVRDPMKLW